jgi:hypothetical protein
MAQRHESIQIRILGTESTHTLLEFSRLLYHLDLTYEVARLATDPNYSRYEFPKHTFRPVISPLDSNDQMILSRVRHESPWQLSVLLHDPITLLTEGLGALWLFIQCLERVSILGLNRKKLRGEIEKLHLEAEKQRRELEAPSSQPAPAITGEEVVEAHQPHLFEAVDDAGWLIPPAESQRLYRRLKRRGAERFYESNINSIHRLGFEVKDFDIDTDGKK